MENLLGKWQLFAIGSAFFAALTAIFAKLGVADIDSNLATFIRTVVILAVVAAIVSFSGQWQRPAGLSLRGLAFLVISGVATGLSWLCYFRAIQLGPVSLVAPVDKLSVALIIVLAVLFLGEPLTLKTAAGGALIVAGSLVMLL